jgi:ATP-binding protein involved in chromosome partitioning
MPLFLFDSKDSGICSPWLSNVLGHPRLKLPAATGIGCSMMNLFSKTTPKVDLAAFQSALDLASAQIVVPELGQNVFELGLVREVSEDKAGIVINAVLPTFGLKSEKEIAFKLKKAAIELAPAGVAVALNVYADVKPAAAQSLRREGVANVKNIVLVASGKGGVGKSTVASNLALALSKLGCQVGLLDADVYGPSLPTMFGVPKDIQIEGVPQGKDKDPLMMPVEREGLRLMSIGFLVDTDTPMVWRGPMIASASMQMFFNVAWGDLDYLIVDLPPGTGDIQLTISQRVVVAGSVVVSTPQDVALADVIRAKNMFEKVNIPILGVVENMSYFLCDGCDKRHAIFSHGGARKMASDLALPFLGEVPIELGVRECGDKGKPVVVAEPASASSKAFFDLAHEVASRLAKAAMKRDKDGDTSMPTIEISGAAPSTKPAKKKGLPILN